MIPEGSLGFCKGLKGSQWSTMVHSGSLTFAEVLQGSLRLQGSVRFSGVSGVLNGSERFFGVLHGSKVLSGFVKDSQGL